MPLVRPPSPAMKKETIVKIGLIALLSIAIIAAYPHVKEYASLEFIKSKQADFSAYYADNRLLVLISYFLLYVAVTALSLPGAAVMTLLAGALFGLAVGTLLVSFASAIGATLAFLVARFLFGETLQQKYGDKLKKINEGVEREGAFYLFTMRLIPAFPFFLINLLMALTKIPTFTFYWVSQTGMFAGTCVFVYAGTELAKISAVGDILSPTLIAAFVAIGLLPLAAKKIVAAIRRRRAA